VILFALIIVVKKCANIGQNAGADLQQGSYPLKWPN